MLENKKKERLCCGRIIENKEEEEESRFTKVKFLKFLIIYFIIK